MTKINPHVILDVSYQGNAWWAICGLATLFILFVILLGARRRRKIGLPVDRRAVIFACVVLLGLFALALFQVSTHQW
jgi:hypothetical protein